jgi:hypothetical protein
MTKINKEQLINFLNSYLNKHQLDLPLRIYKRKQNQLIDIAEINNNSTKIEINMKRYQNLIQEKYLETNETNETNKTYKTYKTYTEHYNIVFENDSYIVIEYKQILQSNELFPNLKSYDYDKNKIILVDEKSKETKIIKDIITFIELMNNDFNPHDLENYIQ